MQKRDLVWVETGPAAPAGASVICTVWVLSGSPQELSPRTFWPDPVGTRIVVAGYQFAEGDVLMDLSVPLYGVNSKIHSSILGYLQTFGLWGRSGNVLLEVPYSVGTNRGLVVETHAGLGDLTAHHCTEDGESKLQLCAEVLLPESTIVAILEQGLMPVISYRNRNTTVLGRFQSIAEPLQPLACFWAGR